MSESHDGRTKVRFDIHGWDGSGHASMLVILNDEAAEYMATKVQKRLEPPPVRVKIVCWDWKDQSPMVEIDAAMKSVYDGQNCPSVVPVEDTGGDVHGVVVSSRPLTSVEAQEAWNETANF